MSKDLCESINLIDQSFDDDPKTGGEKFYGGLLNAILPSNNCSSDVPKLISDFIALLKLFEGINDDDLESDKLAEYAILWLSYKLNQKKQNGTTKLYDFYTENIEKNSCYKDNIDTDSDSKIKKDVICKKIKSMNIDIKDISNFYDAFKSLCNMYIELDPEKNTECKTCLENAEEFFEKYEKLKNALNINKGSSYFQLLSSLSNDYKNLENKYENVGCNNVSPFVACPRSSVTKNILITIAIIFVAASILLGVSYKYSLFGFRKRSQKQHLREMLKK
ncbi:PIR protein [Plasmodium yoelii]|uniref:PIR protein n=2 Tax=Plasmodium yoelii TaxID=5861 RepID=A0AAE9X077_PLAYO|nr:PIR protein [Plasmodium yoelii]WBY59642.1 PIR protein [Plasmodium yoelii yoelii]VTZ80382.1 PIR protein [Plasmodium yoelii]|eukprot:XP_022813446.1 PIR protein [Plasmodium yoelii]